MPVGVITGEQENLERDRSESAGCSQKAVHTIHNRITEKQQDKALNFHVDNSFLLREKKNICPLRQFWQPKISWPKPLLLADTHRRTLECLWLLLQVADTHEGGLLKAIWAEPFQAPWVKAQAPGSR